MIPQRSFPEQDRPLNNPVFSNTRSLLVAFGMAAIFPIALWALENPVYAVGLAAIAFVGVALSRLVDRYCQLGGRSTFHVPGTDFDIEVAVTRPSRR